MLTTERVSISLKIDALMSEFSGMAFLLINKYAHECGYDLENDNASI